MGSDSDLPVMQGAIDTLAEFRVPFEVRILSAHRTPEQTRAYVQGAEQKGLQVFIAGAGWAAHLAGVIASHTTLPVIGVPIDSSPLQGMDALLATVQMPPGIPVATMALGKGGAKNGALFAIEILALQLPELATRLRKYKVEMARQVMEKSERLQQQLKYTRFG